MDMYRENILDHYKKPRNYGSMDKADMTHREFNASCGDDFTFYINIVDGKVADVRFEGTGCAISTASASMLSERVKGMSLKELHALTKEDIFELLGTEIGPGRIKCALLPLKAMMVCIEKYEGRIKE